MTITDKGNYALIEFEKGKLSIAKGAVIVTQDHESVQIRLKGNRQILCMENCVSEDAAKALVQSLIDILY